MPVGYLLGDYVEPTRAARPDDEATLFRRLG
jgi:hypothetical protein